LRNSHGEHEYYSTANGPFGLDSIPGGSIPGVLPQALAAMENCHTGATCWAASHLSPRRGLLPAAAPAPLKAPTPTRP
jgi:hypothetical protein